MRELSIEIGPLLELELPIRLTRQGCRLVGSVEPLAVLLAKLGKQMMGDNRLLPPFSVQTASKYM